MKKNWLLSFAVIALCCCFNSCNTATPEEYFDIAVLNSNMLAGFANDGFERQLESPPAMMVAGQDKPVAEKRIDFLQTQLHFIEEDFAKLKDLKTTEDAKIIIEPSIALYEYVLPVYKKEYSELANLYDDNAPKEKIAALKQSIHDKYAAEFETLYNQLISNGKLYAAKHTIKVNWNVGSAE
ncbi:MAG: hypothetical protein ABJA78_16560 [Ferruginibacter sp.]